MHRIASKCRLHMIHSNRCACYLQLKVRQSPHEGSRHAEKLSCRHHVGFYSSAEVTSESDSDYNDMCLTDDPQNILQDLGKALDDAEACTSLKPTWAKGWTRLGAVLDAKNKLEEAL